MGFLIYLSWPIALILSSIAIVRWLAPPHPILGKIVTTLGRWLLAWCLIGFLLATVLGFAAWLTGWRNVVDNSTMIWPTSISLMALHGKLSSPVIVMVLVLSALKNGVLYLILANHMGNFQPCE